VVLRRLVETGQYTAIRYTDALTAVGALPSIGSVGDSYDNALAESTISQVKAELIHRRGPWVAAWWRTRVSTSRSASCG
jgi:transposase InsO family protein